MEAVPHHSGTSQILRALMMCLELELVDTAPHTVVMLDGSLTTPMLAINQALGQLDDAPTYLAEQITTRVKAATKIIIKIMSSPHVDQVYVGVPKYTKRKDLSKGMLSLNQYEDRGLLSFILKAGEYVGPIPNTASSKPGYLDKYTHTGYADKYQTILKKTDIIYYKPDTYTPVLRLETSNKVTSDKTSLAMLLEAIKLQCDAPTIYEPYPLYMADKMVKHLGSVIPTLRNTTTQYIADQWDGPIHLAHMAMHGYRTETT
jgi:hypothetical protein